MSIFQTFAARRKPLWSLFTVKIDFFLDQRSNTRKKLTPTFNDSSISSIPQRKTKTDTFGIIYQDVNSQRNRHQTSLRMSCELEICMTGKRKLRKTRVYWRRAEMKMNILILTKYKQISGFLFQFTSLYFIQSNEEFKTKGQSSIKLTVFASICKCSSVSLLFDCSVWTAKEHVISQKHFYIWRYLHFFTKIDHIKTKESHIFRVKFPILNRSYNFLKRQCS